MPAARVVQWPEGFLDARRGAIHAWPGHRTDRVMATHPAARDPCTGRARWRQARETRTMACAALTGGEAGARNKRRLAQLFQAIGRGELSAMDNRVT